jgi:hypothetical protein
MAEAKISCRLQIYQFILHQKNDPFYPMRDKMGQWSFFFHCGPEKNIFDLLSKAIESRKLPVLPLTTLLQGTIGSG